MIRTTFVAAFALLIAASAIAQTSEVGVLFGGSKRLISHTDEANGIGVSDNFKFSNSVFEMYYAVLLEENMRFRIKAGQITAPVAFQFVDSGVRTRVDLPKGDVDHIDALVDYRFSEVFGSTGLFAGVGIYRQSGTINDPSLPSTMQGHQEETNYGFQGGVNGDFPINKRTGVIVEVAYHSINYHYRPRYITASGGLRFRF